MAKTWRMRRRAEARDLPIQFRRVEPGVYESVAELSVAPAKTTIADGEYRIHRTVESRRHGGVRWYVTHVPTKLAIWSPYSSRYERTLDDAIHMLHQQIGKGLARGFEALARLHAQAEGVLLAAERIRAAEQEALLARIRLEGRIERGLRDARDAVPMSEESRTLLVAYVADALEGP